MFENNFPYGAYGAGGFGSFSTTPNNAFNPTSYNSSLPNPQMPSMAQQSKPQSNMEWIYVNTADDVANVSVQPNNKAWIMLRNDSVFALKSADNVGVCTTDFYHFEKINGAEKKAETTNYVTKEEVISLLDERLKDMTSKTKKGAKADE